MLQGKENEELLVGANGSGLRKPRGEMGFRPSTGGLWSIPISSYVVKN